MTGEEPDQSGVDEAWPQAFHHLWGIASTLTCCLGAQEAPVWEPE